MGEDLWERVLEVLYDKGEARRAKIIGGDPQPKDLKAFVEGHLEIPSDPHRWDAVESFLRDNGLIEEKSEVIQISEKGFDVVRSRKERRQSTKNNSIIALLTAVLAITAVIDSTLAFKSAELGTVSTFSLGVGLIVLGMISGNLLQRAYKNYKAGIEG